MDSISHLYQDVQNTIARLVKLADVRLQKLEQCLQLRQFEEDSGQVSLFYF